MTSSIEYPLRVVIAGGGVAALETALALRDLCGERISTTLICPDSEFVYRPMRLGEPFGSSAARRYPLSEIAHDIGAELKPERFTWVDPADRIVATEHDRLEYDALVLAPGATIRPRYRHGITLDDCRLDEQLHGLIQDVEGGYVRTLACVVPSRMPWPLPIYELALMTARRAHDMNIELSISLITPEDAPLAIFGQAVSDEVSTLLTEHGILTIPSAHCEVPKPNEVSVNPGSRRLLVDRIVCLPELYGPSTPGLPKNSPNGFIAVDSHCRVRGLDRVYAAGDAIDFPVKFGGLAAQQADAAAQAIAVEAGVRITPKPFHPVMNAILLGGPKPLYLSAHLTGGHGSSSQISDTPTWSPAGKIVARHLSPYLDQRDRMTGRVAESDRTQDGSVERARSRDMLQVDGGNRVSRRRS